MEKNGRDPFEGFVRKQKFLVCIDSDGCAMDTMDIKHHKCFGPCMVTEWGLKQWEEEVLRRWNEVNLYSMTRGINRFKALAVVLAEISETLLPIEQVKDLVQWAKESDELSNASLRKEAERTGSICLTKALHWSEEVNREIELLPDCVKVPFQGVREGLEALHRHADIAIVSSANPDAVEKEWSEHGLLNEVDIMLAQNAGSKAFCIAELLKYGYETNHVMMVGDAPGDMQAAYKNGVFYYPILVRREKESWDRITEALTHLMEGTFTEPYQMELEHEFERNLGESI